MTPSRDKDRVPESGDPILPSKWHHAGTFRNLLDSLPLALVVKNLQGERIFVNRFYLDLHDVSEADVVGKSDYDLFPSATARAFLKDDQRVIDSGEVIQDIERLPLRAGDYRWIERIKGPARDVDGNIIGVQLLFWDVTRRKNVEAELDKERAYLHALLNNLPDAIYFKDQESRFLKINVGMAKKHGLASPIDAVGKTDADIFTQEHASKTRRDELTIMKTGNPIIARVEKETWADREDSWCSSTKLPLLDKHKNVVGTFGMSRDITAQKLIELQLRDARDAANAANAAKGEFLANMSHEIRTPMNGILGMAELLTHTSLSQQQQDYVELIQQSGESLLRLLNDILDFSKIEAGHMELELTPFTMSETIAKSIQMLAFRAESKQIDLACRVHPELPNVVLGDPNRLRQVIVNLVGNSIKFTEHGEIVVEVQPLPSTAESVFQQSEASDAPGAFGVRISVRDTGIGIAADKLEHIFEAFTQADASTTRRYGGTGLGLAISNRLVQLMGGVLRVESELGQGTTFYFDLPMTPGELEGGNTDFSGMITNLVDLPVLIVDDNSTNRKVLIELLEYWNLKPTAVSSASQAIAELRQAVDADQPFQLGLFDMMMPDIDGLMLTETLRNETSLADLPVIMLSSLAHGADLERCRAAGITRYLLKPFVHSELLNAILETFTPEGIQPDAPEPQTGPAVSSPAKLPGLQILLAEDGLVNQRVAIELLRLRGHNVTLACDGREAVEMFSKAKFDLVLMDLQMPELDGFEATAAIHQLEQDEHRSRHTPIVAMTARAMPDDRQLCLEAGMDGYIAKPVDPQLLDELLAKFQRTPAESGQEPAAEAAGTETHDNDQAVVLDLAPLLKRFGGKQAIVTQLAETFALEGPELLQQMERALAQQTPAELRRAAHTMKGSVDLFGAGQLRLLCEELEQTAESEQWAALLPLVQRITDAHQIFVAELSKAIEGYGDGVSPSP